MNVATKYALGVQVDQSLVWICLLAGQGSNVQSTPQVMTGALVSATPDLVPGANTNPAMSSYEFTVPTPSVFPDDNVNMPLTSLELSPTTWISPGPTTRTVPSRVS